MKKIYEKPTLVIHGSLASTTQSLEEITKIGDAILAQDAMGIFASLPM